MRDSDDQYEALDTSNKFVANIVPCFNCNGWKIQLIETNSLTVQATQKMSSQSFCVEKDISWKKMSGTIMEHIKDIVGDDEYILLIRSNLRRRVRIKDEKCNKS